MKKLTPRVLAFLLSVSLILPPPALALRETATSEKNPKTIAGLEEDLKDPGKSSRQLAQLSTSPVSPVPLAVPPVAPAENLAGVEEVEGLLRWYQADPALLNRYPGLDPKSPPLPSRDLEPPAGQTGPVFRIQHSAIRAPSIVGDQKVKPDACPLCLVTMQAAGERWIPWRENSIKPNVRPAILGHQVVINNAHTPQTFDGRVAEEMLELADLLPGYRIFYNEPGSIPRHDHRQAIPVELPVEREVPQGRVAAVAGGPALQMSRLTEWPAPVWLFRGRDRKGLVALLTEAMALLAEAKLGPMTIDGQVFNLRNLLILQDPKDPSFILAYLIPRTRQDPPVFPPDMKAYNAAVKANDPSVENHYVVKPATLEMAGFLITSDKSTFDRMTHAAAAQILKEVSPSWADLSQVEAKLQALVNTAGSEGAAPSIREILLPRLSFLLNGTGALAFDVDDTLLPARVRLDGKYVGGEDLPEEKAAEVALALKLMDQLVEILKRKVRVVIISGNSRASQTERLIQPLRGRLGAADEAALRFLTLYTAGGATRTAFDETGKEVLDTKYNIPYLLPSGILDLIQKELEKMLDKTQLNLNPQEKNLWKEWYASRSRSPEFPNTDFSAPWMSGGPTTLSVVAAGTLMPEMSAPYIETRDGAGLTIAFLPDSVVPEKKKIVRQAVSGQLKQAVVSLGAPLVFYEGGFASVDITKEAADKAVALRHEIGQRELKSDGVVYFGDGFPGNDESVLQVLGILPIAVGEKAPPSALDATGRLTYGGRGPAAVSQWLDALLAMASGVEETRPSRLIQGWSGFSPKEKQRLSDELRRAVGKERLRQLVRNARQPVVPPYTLYELLSQVLGQPMGRIQAQVGALSGKAWTPPEPVHIGESRNLAEIPDAVVKDLLENTLIMVAAGGAGSRFKNALPKPVREQLDRLGRLEKVTVAVGASGASPILQTLEEISALSEKVGATRVNVILLVGQDSRPAIEQDLAANGRWVDSADRVSVGIVEADTYPSFDPVTGEILTTTDPSTGRVRLLRNPNGTYDGFLTVYRWAQKRGLTKGKSWLILYGDESRLHTPEFLSRVLFHSRDLDVATVTVPKLTRTVPPGGTRVDLALPGGPRVPLIIEDVERTPNPEKGIAGLPVFNQVEDVYSPGEDPFGFNTGVLKLSERAAAAATSITPLLRYADRPRDDLPEGKEGERRNLETFLTHVLSLLGSRPEMRSGDLRADFLQYQAVKNPEKLARATLERDRHSRIRMKQLPGGAQAQPPGKEVHLDVRPGFSGFRGEGQLTLSGATGFVLSRGGLYRVPVVQTVPVTLKDPDPKDHKKVIERTVQHPVFVDPGQAVLLLPANPDGTITLDKNYQFTAAGAEEQPEKLTWRAWWKTLGSKSNAYQALQKFPQLDQATLQGRIHGLINRRVNQGLNPSETLRTGIPLAVGALTQKQFFDSLNFLFELGTQPGFVWEGVNKVGGL